MIFPMTGYGEFAASLKFLRYRRNPLLRYIRCVRKRPERQILLGRRKETILGRSLSQNGLRLRYPNQERLGEMSNARQLFVWCRELSGFW